MRCLYAPATRAVLDALLQLSRELPVVLPLHPRTRKTLTAARLQQLADRLLLIEPLGYLEMLLLEKNARLITTDSGGVQKEAFFFRIPCVTFRKETEWTELVDLGWNRLAPPTDSNAVLNVCRQALNGPGGEDASPYGDGNACERIADEVIALLAQPTAVHPASSAA